MRKNALNSARSSYKPATFMDSGLLVEAALEVLREEAQSLMDGRPRCFDLVVCLCHFYVQPAIGRGCAGSALRGGSVAVFDERWFGLGGLLCVKKSV